MSAGDDDFDELIIDDHQVLGNYELLEVLGAGGGGAVYRARHVHMKRIVALKLLALNLTKDEPSKRRFQREVETIAQLTHPNIVMAFDAGLSDEGYFLAMELIDGCDLQVLVNKEGPLSVPAAVDYIVQAARGLEYAHGRGIIHRDIKPANLLRDRHGVIKVTDMGLARLRDTSLNNRITQAGAIVGTVDFMPPEQGMDPTKTDHRSDIYSLGATLCFLLTGKPPYPETSLMGALLKHREAPIPSLAKARPEVPPALDAFVQRMLAKAPADRFQSITEVLAALTAIQANLGPATASKAPSLPPSDQSPNLVDRELTAQTIARTLPIIPDAGRLKVVLVEPSRVQAGIIRRFLQAAGIKQLVEAASGKDALNAVRADKPDAIICALHLGDMTGVQLAQQIRGESATPPGFLLISSEAESSEAGSLSKYGKGLVLQKPFTPERLAEALKVVAQAPAGAPEHDTLKVLIVDDSSAARLHFRNVLKEVGLEHFVDAADGAQAVAALARERFDLIITDYYMPFMDGGGLVGYLKQNPATAAVPVIMATTETDKSKLDAVRQQGVTVCDKSLPAAVVLNVIGQIAHR